MIETLAIDIGAGSGRIYNGSYDGIRIKLKEIYRFEHKPIKIEGKTVWNFEYILKSVREGIKLSKEQIVKIDSMAIDSWAPDYLLFDPSGSQYGHFYSYLDERTKDVLSDILHSVSAQEIYKITGNCPFEISLLCQLIAQIESDQTILERDYKILPLSNALMFMLCGKTSIDFTVASTSMMFDYRKMDWSDEILSHFNIGKKIFPIMVDCGTKVGTLVNDQKDIDLICTGSHDSALAIYTAKKIDEGDVTINCGTWSIIGLPVDEPITNETALDHGFTNYGLPDESFVFCKIIKGLWFIQACKNHWVEKGEEYSYDDISKMAEVVAPTRHFIIDLNEASFRNEAGLPQKIQKYCEDTYDDYPHDPGEISRCIYESLALEYRKAINQIESISGRRINSIHLMGGGSQDRLLCQLIAERCELKVTAGPVESTVLGNVLMQLSALGEIDDGEKIQKMIRASEKLETYFPKA